MGLVEMLDAQPGDLLWSVDQGPVQRAALQQVDDLIGTGPLLLAVTFAMVEHAEIADQ
ncbi:hypothetical protein D3C84_1197070 [compost metagenome]